MSQDIHHAELWTPPRQKVPVLWVSEQNISDFWSLFVNRKAYTRQRPPGPRKRNATITIAHTTRSPRNGGNWIAPRSGGILPVGGRLDSTRSNLRRSVPSGLPSMPITREPITISKI